MDSGQSSKFYFTVIILIAVMALAGLIISYDGISWQSWPQILVFAALTCFFHSTPVGFGTRISYSLSTAVIFPILYFSGRTEAVMLVALGGLVDGYVGRKSWERVTFNVAQFVLSALAGSFVMTKLGAVASPLWSLDVVPIVLGGLTYIVVNVLLVTGIVSVWTGRNWGTSLASFGLSGLLISLGSGYIGFIFTLFVKSYGFWGIVLFGALLVQLATLLRVGAVVKGERDRRKKLEQELIVDEMTQVYNFRYLSNWLTDPRKEAVAALFLDIDDFKSFNDRYGHAEGDRVLRILAKTISKSVRANDKVIRYGGEEFVVLLPEMDSLAAKRVAQRILDNLRRLPYARWQRPLTVSIGIASCPQDTQDKHQLMFIVDQAMYRAKTAGKNTFYVWQDNRGPA